jgi:hypothetical protein
VAVVRISESRYHAGDRAQRSGVYRVVHVRHRKPHRVLMIQGDEFPPCRFCKQAVTFQLVEPSEYIAHDLDFAGLPIAKFG